MVFACCESIANSNVLMPLETFVYEKSDLDFRQIASVNSYF